MHDNRSHHLLEQVPLTVSPFINLPTANTLPYTYKSMPSTLPPSVLSGPPGSSNPPAADPGAPPSSSAAAPSSSAAASATTAAPDPSKPRFVVSSSGHAAHPDDIVGSCRALSAYVTRLQADAERELRAFDDAIAARELAEKRRVAPGWLDSDARLLEPERASGGSLVDDDDDDDAVAAAEHSVVGRLAGLNLGAGAGPGLSEMAAGSDAGAELDRAFGGLTFGSGR